MGATHTALRIQKLMMKGLGPESIARKIGRPNEVERVVEEAKRLGIEWTEGKWKKLPE